MTIGFIKLHRKITSWEWYSDNNTFRVFMHLLLKANYEDKKWQGYNIKRGQLVTSFSSLATETNLTIQQIRTSIKKLKSTHEITVQTTNRFTLIELVNYESYQGKSNEDNTPDNMPLNKQTTNKQQTDNKRITTTKEVKKKRSKEVKKQEAIFDLPNFVESELWNKFVEHRISKKAALNQNSAEMIIKKLTKWENKKEGNANQAIEDCIAGGWQGLFEPKESNNNTNKSNLAWLNK